MMLGGSIRLLMKSEHCERKDSKTPFNASNGAKGASAKNEWEFVNEPRSGVVYMEAEAFGMKRKQVQLKAFEDKMKEVRPAYQGLPY